MDRMVEEFIRECKICVNSDRVLESSFALIQPTEWPSRAWEKLAVDIRGPDHTLGQQYQFVLVVADYYSKWAEVKLLREVSTNHVIKMFRELFNREGIPECVASDNGPQFVGHLFAEFLSELGIRHQRVPIYSPISNGLVEIFHRALGGFMETAKQLVGDIAQRIERMVGTYNATPSSNNIIYT
ncbi:uncharacterized protein K02A2.6-like [Galendromus occidentalis]|uniref:Uncharacterized protein K02A2.6-like n=1 Tax=Galendromus occidentalis TaxID=34638 RepID=A0AAJ6QM91_9ACAR|nr:uncharacterized protein K02A2.6-like [Galendromus occidentalis]